MMFTSQLASIRRVWACFFASAQSANRTAVQRGPRPVDLVSLAQFSQENAVQFLPHAHILPSLEIVQTGHTRTTAHLLRQVFPGNAGLEYKNNPCQHLA